MLLFKGVAKDVESAGSPAGGLGQEPTGVA
jgi:hypothetical protein